MSNQLLFARVRAISAAESDSFVELVKLSGLEPRRDFRNADLSRADLRGQDMRSFDLRGASLRGALIQGARFNNSVSRAQLKEAIAGVPAVLLPVGERLLKLREAVARHLGEKVLVPEAVVDSLSQLLDEPMRRQRRIGAYIGDSSDLVRRRLSGRFRDLSRTLKASGACFIVAEPQTDLDFDTLNVIQGYLRRDGVRTFSFVLPQAMMSDPALSALAQARLRALPKGSWMNLNETRRGHKTHLHAAPPQGLSLLENAREKVIAFVWVVANARPQWCVRARLKGVGVGEAELFDGARRPRESIADAIIRELYDDSPDAWGFAERQHVFVREDLYSTDLGSIIAAKLGGQRVTVEVSTFPHREGYAAEYYAVAGPAASDIWNALRLRR